jgi:glycerol transport system permease protein
MNKVYDNKAWLLILPMLALVSFSAIIPLMTVVNYSVQDVFDANTRFFTGTEWFTQMLNDLGVARVQARATVHQQQDNVGFFDGQQRL